MTPAGLLSVRLLFYNDEETISDALPRVLALGEILKEAVVADGSTCTP